MDLKNSAISLDPKRSPAVLRSILDSKLLVELRKRPPLKDLMDLVRDVPSIMLLDADSPNGELSSRSIQQMDYLPIWLSKSVPIPLLDMDLSANKMDLLQLSSLKFFKMVITVSKYALKFPREFSPVS